MEMNIEKVIEKVLPEDIEKVLPEDIEKVLPEDIEKVLPEDIEKVLPEDIEKVLPEDIEKVLPEDIEKVLPEDIEKVLPEDIEKVKLTEAKLDGDVQIKTVRSANSKRCTYIITMTYVTLFVQLAMLVTSLNPATPALARFFNSSFLERYSEPASQATLTLLISLTMSMMMAGAIVGSITTKFFALSMSRRTALIWYHALTLFSIVLMSVVTYIFRSWEAIIVGRFINGFARGFGMNIATMYVNEMSSHAERSKSQSMNGWLIGLGFVLGIVVGHPKVMGNDTMWPYLVALPGILSMFFLINIYIVPNPPVHYMKRGETSKAYEELLKLRQNNKAAINAEYSELEKMLHDSSAVQQATIVELFTNPVYRKQLVTAALTLVNIQFVGFMNILFYSDSMFVAAGVAPDKVTLPSIGVCAEMTIISFVGKIMLNKLNRRRLLISGNLLVIASCAVLCVSMSLKDLSSIMPIITIAAVAVYMLGVGGGPLLVSFPLMAESISKYPQAQGPIMAIAGTAFWMASSLVSFTQPYLFKLFGPYAWLVYAGVTGVFTLIFIFVLKLPR